MCWRALFWQGTGSVLQVKTERCLREADSVCPVLFYSLTMASKLCRSLGTSRLLMLPAGAPSASLLLRILYYLLLPAAHASVSSKLDQAACTVCTHNGPACTLFALAASLLWM